MCDNKGNPGRVEFEQKKDRICISGSKQHCPKGMNMNSRW
jgi:hypothetical protein